MEILLDVLKWSAVAGAAVLALTALKPLLDRRYSARWRYWVWLALAALLLLSPVQWENLLPQAEVPPPVVIQVPRLELSISREEGAALHRPSEGVPVQPAQPADRAERAAGPKAARSWSLDALLPALWLAGTAVYAVYRLLGTVLFVRRARRWSRGAGEETVRVFEEVQRELGVRRAPALRVSARVDSPMMAGLLRPCLLLPEETYGERELGFILRHELCHYRRRDLWYKLVLLLANALHWFNPLAYLLVREAEADLELTCDDLVVRGAGSETRRAYSETLLAAVRRQKGLSRAALSTHFYGGKAVMKERLRNILGRRGRKWGVLALALALAATAACAFAFGLKQEDTPPPETAEGLGAEELAELEEQLNSPEYNGFLTRMYTDVRYLPLDALFYDGAGIARNATDEEQAALEEQLGAPIETDVTAIDVRTMDAYLEHHTGLTRGDFAGSAQVLRWNDGKTWAELEQDGTYFNVHGDTTFTPVTVLGGSRLGNTVSLELQAGSGDWALSFADGETTGILTIEDGKIKSFTTPLYTASEKAAWEILEETDAGPDIQDASILDLRVFYSCEYGGRTYSVWHPIFWVNGSEEEQTKRFILSADKDGNVVREEIFEDTMGYHLSTYVVCHTALGMELTAQMAGWPTASAVFMNSVWNGPNNWVMSWESTALHYAQTVLGETVLEDGILRIMDFQPVPPSQTPDLDEELLAQVSCEGGDWLLLLKKYGQEGMFSYWQVQGAVFAGEAAERAETPDAAGGYDGPLETAEDYANMYAAAHVDNLQAGLEKAGTTVLGNRFTLEREGTYAWDHYDSEIQVWRLDYGIQLADPDSYQPVGGEFVDEDGCLSGLDPQSDTPYLILSRQAGDDDWKLAETAYGCVEWEYGFCWETWVLAHTVHGLDMGAKLNAWPDVDTLHSDFLQRMTQGENSWAKEWETTAREYCRFMLGMEDCTISPVAEVRTGDAQADRDVLVSFSGEELSGMLLLSHWNYEYAVNQTVSFWEVTGRQWQRELSAEELTEFAGYFNEREHNGLLRFPYESFLDIGPYLDELFYDLDGQAASMTGEEQETAGLSGMFDARKLTSSYVADYICENFGIAATGLGYEWLLETYGKENLDRLGTYLPEYGAWYSERSDTQWHEYAFEYGWEYPDGSVRLDFTPSATRYLGANGTKTIVFDRSMYALIQSADRFNRYMTYNRFGYE